jgi:hypothetical protein
LGNFPSALSFELFLGEVGLILVPIFKLDDAELGIVLEEANLESI